MTPSKAARQARIRGRVTDLFAWIEDRALNGAKPQDTDKEIGQEANRLGLTIGKTHIKAVHWHKGYLVPRYHPANYARRLDVAAGRRRRSARAVKFPDTHRPPVVSLSAHRAADHEINLATAAR
jgi:hypothetical protein